MTSQEFLLHGINYIKEKNMIDKIVLNDELQRRRKGVQHELQFQDCRIDILQLIHDRRISNLLNLHSHLLYH